MQALHSQLRRLADVAAAAAGRRSSSARSCPGAADPSTVSRDRVDERRVALELGQPEGRPEAPDDGVRSGRPGCPGRGRARRRRGSSCSPRCRRSGGRRAPADCVRSDIRRPSSRPSSGLPPAIIRGRASLSSGIVSRAMATREGGPPDRRPRGRRSRTRTRSTSRRPGYTKLDLVHYYLAVADGALRGAGGRPMALKRFVDGAAGAAVLPEARPGEPARLHPDRDADLPVRPDRRRDRRRRRGRARLGRQPRLHRPQPAPGPGRRPRPSRRAAGRPRPGARACRGRRSARSRWSTREALEAVGLVGWPKTSGSRGIHINVRIEPRWTFPEVRRAALALARDVERRAPDARHLASGGRRSATASSSTTTRTPRTGRWRPPTPSGRCPTRGSRRR